MQIISGLFKGKKLFSNQDTHTRPLTSRLKVTLFDLISHHISNNLSNFNIIDCFAGFGNFALECLSKESKSIYLIENNKNTLQILTKNINLFPQHQNYINLINKDFFCLNSHHFSNLNINHKHIIFLDPPYNQDLIFKSIEKLSSLNLLQNTKLLILKTEHTFNLSNIKDILNTNHLTNHIQKKISSSYLNLFFK